jgi:hypothetical protein
VIVVGIVVALIIAWACWPLWIAKREEWQADNGARGAAYERARSFAVCALGLVLLVCILRVAGWLGMDRVTQSAPAPCADYACKVQRAGPPVEGMRPLR